MKWLLITAHHENPGDQFARLGVERIIRLVDPIATFHRVNKHSRAIHNPVLFDYAVVCGMPLAWSFDTSHLWLEHWWSAIRGWIRETGPILFAGVGSFQPLHSPLPSDQTRLRKEIHEIVQHAYVRDSHFNTICGTRFPVLPCPSVLALGEVLNQPPLSPEKLRLCNLMEHCGHYPSFNTFEDNEAWAKNRGWIAATLRDNGFKFVAHSEDEYIFAERLGFSPSDILTYGHHADEFLRLYARCEAWFGNRIHGAMVAWAAGADTWHIGNDSRQSILPQTVRRSQRLNLVVQLLEKWIKNIGKHITGGFNDDTELFKQAAIFTQFVKDHEQTPTHDNSSDGEPQKEGD